MEQKRRTLDQLTDAGQDVQLLLRSADATAQIDKDTEELTQRWDNLVQKLEDCSNQVGTAELNWQPRVYRTEMLENTQAFL